MAAAAAEPKKPSRKPKATVVLNEAASRSLIDWTPALIRAAEIQADRGNLQMAADLVELIMTDDRVMGVSEALCSVVSLPLSFEPEDSEVSIALAGRFGDWWKMLPEPELKRLLKWGRILGVGLAYIKGWNRDPETGRLLADVEVWHPRNLRCDRRTNKWTVITADGVEVEVTPGDGTWILYTPYGAKRPWADAPWRGISRWWLIKRYAQHDWAFYSERQGNGTEVVHEDQAAPQGLPLLENEDAQKRRDELVAELKKLKRNAKIVLPPGFKYKLVESIARTWETFKAQKECADAALAISIVGQNLTSEVKTGSLAAAEVHAKVEWRVIRDVAESLSTTARAQLLTWYAFYNFGTRIAPWPLYDTRPPEDIKAKAEAQLLFMEMLTEAKTAGFSVENAVELGEKYGLTLKPLAVDPKAPTKANDAAPAN